MSDNVASSSNDLWRRRYSDVMALYCLTRSQRYNMNLHRVLCELVFAWDLSDV